ncbi:unnamed protein product [Brassica oleracea]|uniref:(rape) hypothetical protein n=1 Tax=Brassica napus TaxID=3708 RepID=A0A816TV16_BRANA|nr:unnamed protein product [Brassica napus]
MVLLFSKTLLQYIVRVYVFKSIWGLFLISISAFSIKLGRGSFPTRATIGQGATNFVKKTPQADHVDARGASYTDLKGQIHMNTVEEVESIVVLQHFSNTDGDENKVESIVIVVKPHKRCLFGLGTTQMENNYHIDPPGRRSYSSISFREGVD